MSEYNNTREYCSVVVSNIQGQICVPHSIVHNDSPLYVTYLGIGDTLVCMQA